MRTNYTPGPWNRENDTVTSCDGDIAILHYQSATGVDRLKANARLIAAAPELLEALKSFVHAVDHEGVISGRVSQAYNESKTLIKQVENTKEGNYENSTH